MKEAGELGDFGETGVAAEQFITTDAGEGDFSAGVAGETRDDKGIEAINAWLVNFVEVIVKKSFTGFIRKVEIMVMTAEVPGGLLRDIALIEAGIIDGNGEGFGGLPPGSAGESEERRGVQAAAEEEADGDVADEVGADGVEERLSG